MELSEIKKSIASLLVKKEEQIIGGKVDSFEHYKKCVGYIEGVRDALKVIEVEKVITCRDN